jgi:uncharacterized membrane-anchored protein
MLPLSYLVFDFSEATDGITALEAMASTSARQHADVLAEAQQVLDWAWRRFPNSHGPVEEGGDWDHDLQVVMEDGRWHTVTLTLTGSAHFVDELRAALGALPHR